MADIGDPIRRREIIPLDAPTKPTGEPLLPKPPVRVAPREKEPVR